MENHLKNETSPYLLQHKDNPVDWYPWGEEAFEKAKHEDKPVFLSIGYSTCHWCHVIARESFEDAETAEALNKYFVCIKVDREERPDIDSIYMSVCQAMTGSGGWPLSVFITPDQKPFFSGTYFPKPAFLHILYQIHALWETNRGEITKSGTETANILSDENAGQGELTQDMIDRAFNQLKNSFDSEYGGFGYAPKFPTPHNLIFLLDYYRQTQSQSALEMAENTLTQMYRGGIFDHIGYGFSRYSTDRYFLAPHFEKMLYDNALLMMSYITAYSVTNNGLYREIAEKISDYVLREMTDKDGGFYSAQDADSEGEEGKYYLFKYDEIPSLIGEQAGKEFNEHYGITEKGNFEGKNIPNLLLNPTPTDKFKEYIPKIYSYRKSRTHLNLDDKILTAWNSLMIGAYAMMYRALGEEKYLNAAERAYVFIEENLSDGGTLFVSYRDGNRGRKGFLDDYAFYIFALIELYEASFEQKYLDRAIALCKKTVNDFYDTESGGFYLYGSGSEQLLMRPKETYDGALPSGNSVMAYNLVLLSQITEDNYFEDMAEMQLKFMAGRADDYPMGYCFYMWALSLHLNPPTHIVCAVKETHQPFPFNSVVKLAGGDDKNYPLINGRTTYYVCKGKTCLPPTNDLK